MIRNFFTLICAGSLCGLMACERPQQDPQTRLFADYLLTHFNQKIQQEPHRYLLIPTAGCQGGMAHTLQLIEQQAPYPAGVTVITTNRPMATQYLHQPWPLLEDSSGDLDVLNLPLSNVSLIRTRGGKIEVIHAEPECAAAPTRLIQMLRTR